MLKILWKINKEMVPNLHKNMIDKKMKIVIRILKQ